MKILDCTLRDGGYVNNWGFDTENATTIIQGLYSSGIRHIEIGLMGQVAHPQKQTKFQNFLEIEYLLENRHKDCTYAVMMVQTDAKSFSIPERSCKTVDCIRLAFFKPDWKDAVQYAYLLKEKGYKIFLQAMASQMYSNEELKELINAVNVIMPQAFYMVDSFSTMYNSDVIQMATNISENLSKDIMFGFHAHNNIQMAFSNTIAFLTAVNGHESIVDSSIYGMGRGAGNVPTELLLEYMNSKFNMNYDLRPIMRIFEDNIKPIYEISSWGYNMEYFLTACHNTNAAYGWCFKEKGISNLSELQWLLERIPLQERYTLKKDVVNRLLNELEGFRSE